MPRTSRDAAGSAWRSAPGGGLVSVPRGVREDLMRVLPKRICLPGSPAGGSAAKLYIGFPVDVGRAWADGNTRGGVLTRVIRFRFS